MNVSKKKIIVIACIVLAVIVFLAVFLGRKSNSENYGSDAGTVITEKRLADVGEVLRQAQLSNTDLFETWVYEYFEAKEDNRSAYSDTDSLMAAMLLADDQVKCEKPEEYKGEYLKEDLSKINKEGEYIFIKDNEKVFTSLFGEMTIPKEGIKEALPANWKKHKMKFLNEKSSLVSVVSPAKDKKTANVIHAGILVDMKGMDTKLEGKYLFVEKLGYGDAFFATEMESTKGLMELFSQREGFKEESEPLQVYLNDQHLGELAN